MTSRATLPLDRRDPRVRFIQAYTPHRCVGVLLEFGLNYWLHTEHPEFVELAHNLTVHVSASNPQSVDALLQQAYFSNPAVTVAETLAETSARLGQEISVTRFIRWSNEPQPRVEAQVCPKTPRVSVRRVCSEGLALVADRSSTRIYPQLRFIQSYAVQGLVGVLVEFGLETWQVTERPEFRDLSHIVALTIAARNPKSLHALLHDLPTLAKLLAASSEFLRERISITRFVRWGDFFESVPPRDPAVALRLKHA